jgi:branched-chain amino acid transport system ATP-binding protein
MSANIETSPAPPLLEARRLCAGYDGSEVLHDVNFSARSSEVVALMGRNGMGKTTLLRALLGLVSVHAGEACIDGQPVAGRAPFRIARLGLAYVPEGRGVFAPLSVRENLEVAAREADGNAGGWTLPRVLALLPRLEPRLGQRAGTLSGGEQQMLTLGRALMTQPRMLLLDEATEGLAPLVAHDVWQALRALRDDGVGMVIVDKNFAVLSRLADRCVMLVNGAVVFDAPPAQLATQPELLERWLGV